MPEHAQLVLVAYPPGDPLGTPLGVLADAAHRAVTVDDEGAGSGSFIIHPASPQAAWCTPGTYVLAYRDAVTSPAEAVAGFWLEEAAEVVLSPDEEGGRAVEWSGRGSIAYLADAVVWHRAVSGRGGTVHREKGEWRWRDAHPARVLVRLLEEAQARRALAALRWDFTRTRDSDGTAFTANAEKYVVPIGTDLLTFVDELRAAGLAVSCTPDLVLRAWDASGRDLSGSITFTARIDIRDTVEREIGARRARSHLLMEGENKRSDLRYRPVRDPAIEAAIGRRREGFFRFTRTATPALLTRVGERKLRRWALARDGPVTLPVLDTAGQVALVDYTAGDTVSVPTAFAASGSERIAAITLTEAEDGSYEVTLELGDVAPDASTGRSLGGDTSGQDCCGGAGGAGDKPGSGGGSGGSVTIVEPDAEPLVLTDFECVSTGELTVHATAAGVVHHYVEGDTTATIALPAGWDEVPGRYLLVLVHEAADSDLQAEMEAAGFTKGTATVGSDLFYRRLDGSEPWIGDTFVLDFAGESVELAAVTMLISGLYEELPAAPGLWYVASSSLTADPNDVPAPAWAGAPAIVITTCRTDGAAITAGPAGYTEAGTDDGTSIALRADYQLMAAAAEDPGAYTASGVERTDTYLVRGGDCDLWRLPLQDDAAWWPGGNVWSSFFAAYVGEHGIADGVFFAESAASHQTSGNNWSMSVLGEGHPDGGSYLPMQADDWELELRYRLLGAAGSPTDPGLRYLSLDWMFSGRVRLDFGDAINAEGITLIGETIETKPKALTPLGDWGRIRWRWQDGIVSAKEWAEETDEPAGWDVSAAVSSALDETDLEFVIIGRLGNASGPLQRIEIDTIALHPVASSGSAVRRVLPHGEGAGPYTLGEPFTPGTLRVWVDDRPVTPSVRTASAGTFALAAPVYHDPARHPRGCAVLVVVYEVA